MKKTCFCLLASFTAFVLSSTIASSCSKKDIYREFEVSYEEKTDICGPSGIGNGEYNIVYPYFKDYPELNEIVAKKLKEEKEAVGDAVDHNIGFGDIRTSGKYIGFMFNSSYYHEGAAHGQTKIFPVNYDTETKKEVSLKDVFLPLSKDYLKIFSEFSYKELTSRVERGEFESSDDFITNGTDIEESNFECFNMKGSEVIIVFNQYQVAPYASGISEVNIPLSVFK